MAPARKGRGELIRQVEGEGQKEKKKRSNGNKTREPQERGWLPCLLYFQPCSLTSPHPQLSPRSPVVNSH